MNIDWGQVIIAFLGGGGLFGFIAAILTLKQQRRKLDADASVIIKDALCSIIDPMKRRITELEAEIAILKVENTDKDRLIRVQTRQIEHLQAAVEAKEAAIAALEESVAILKLKRGRGTTL